MNSLQMSRPCRCELSELMRHQWVWLAVVLAFVVMVGGSRLMAGEVALAEEKEMEIACEWRKTLTMREVPVFESRRECDAAMGSYHYKLWLPKGYLAQPERRWPCMFIASPGGNAEMGNMGARLRRDYVVAMLVESKNGEWAPIVGNFLAAHDDLVKRVRVQEGLKFATGMSGGAAAASLFVQLRDGFAGVILQGGGFATDASKTYIFSGIRKTPGFLVGQIFGESDQYRGQIERLKGMLPTSARFFQQTFPGGHEWAPADKFSAAVDWMERQIYAEGPVRAALKPAYAAYFGQRYGMFQALTVPWEKYRAADALLKLARDRALGLEPSLAPQLRDVQTTYTRLRADPAVVREAAAMEALERLLADERGAAAAKVAADRADFVKRHAGTEAAKLAGESSAAMAGDGKWRKTFTFTSATAQSVCLAGDFNGWNAKSTPLKQTGSVWSVTMPLASGRHQYKFVVDGQWMPDPANPARMADADGNQNSVFDLGAEGK